MWINDSAAGIYQNHKNYRHDKSVALLMETLCIQLNVSRKWPHRATAIVRMQQPV